LHSQRSFTETNSSATSSAQIYQGWSSYKRYIGIFFNTGELRGSFSDSQPEKDRQIKEQSKEVPYQEQTKRPSSNVISISRGD
jgi:hypothetical protein